jgi:phosphate transport system protein
MRPREHFAHQLKMIHNFERMADRATNIAERIVYIASGDVVELNS